MSKSAHIGMGKHTRSTVKKKSECVCVCGGVVPDVGRAVPDVGRAADLGLDFRKKAEC
jgi:hypothetical protein